MTEREFQGGVFNADLPTGRSGAVIRMDAGGISAEAPASAGGRRFRIGYLDCALEQGGASGRMIFCRDGGRKTTIFCEDRAFVDALRAAAAGALDGQLSEMRVAVGRQSARARRAVVIGVVLVALLGLGGYRGFRWAGKAAVRSLPISVDQKIGELAWSAMDRQGPEVHDEVVVGAIRKMVDRLAPHAAIKGLDFRVAVIDAPIVNAFCLPGGRIVVFTGLIRKASDPAQVAGVLGHEIAHATLRHGLQRIAQSAGVIIAIELMIGDVGGLMALAAQLAQQGLITSYGREQETAADMDGLRMTHAAGIDGAGLERFFAALEKEGGDVPAALTWLSSHPQLAERRAAIRNRLTALGPTVEKPWGIDWDDVVRRAGNPSLTVPAAPGPTGMDRHGKPAEDTSPGGAKAPAAQPPREGAK